MSVELTVALISAVVALLSILLSARAARSSAVLQARLNDEVEQRREKASSQSRLAEVVSRYRDPLLGAAFDLQSRIYNLVVGDIVDLLLTGDQEVQRYAVNSTLFVIGQYLGWVEALRRGVQYLDLGDVDDSRELVRCLIRHSFSTRHAIEESPFHIYRGRVKRAIGRVGVLKGRLDERSGHMLWHCRATCASFSARLDRDQIFASWFTRLGLDVRALATSRNQRRARLVQYSMR